MLPKTTLVYLISQIQVYNSTSIPISLRLPKILTNLENDGDGYILVHGVVFEVVPAPLGRYVGS